MATPRDPRAWALTTLLVAAACGGSAPPPTGGSGERAPTQAPPAPAAQAPAVAAQSSEPNPTEARKLRPVEEAARVLDPVAGGIGRLVPDLAFEDLEGNAGRLSDFSDQRALVLLTRDTGCPVSKRTGPELARLEEDYTGRGVAFLFVNPGSHETREAVEAEIEAYGFSSPYHLDREEAFAAALGIRTTTECFVLDAARTLVYRGAVDDRIGRGVQKREVENAYLRDALEAVLAGEPVAVETTSAPGCFLEPPTRTPEATPPTYHGDASRVLQRHCQRCHHEGGSAPFALDSYAQARGRRGMLRFVVEEEIMPPWFASEESGPWANDVSLSEADRRTLLDWIAAGAPEGDPADAPLPVRWPDARAWGIGVPDFTVALPEPIDIPAEGFIDYQRVETSKPIPEGGRWVQAIQVLPTAPEVVHHVVVRYKTPDGRWPFFDAIFPGKPPTIFPEGTARFVPEGSVFGFIIHYAPSGIATQDQLELGLAFADEPPEHEIVSLGVQNTRFTVPAGAQDFEVRAFHRFPEKVKLFHLRPHMHLRGKSYRAEVQYPSGRVEELLRLDQWDFDWQYPYVFAEPRIFPAGTRLRCTAWYDNSSNNPANPDPTIDVQSGPLTEDEMMGTYLEYVRID